MYGDFMPLVEPLIRLCIDLAGSMWQLICSALQEFNDETGLFGSLATYGFSLRNDKTDLA